ncbi:MAG: urease accessory protein UreD [Pseudomonadales bacterium]|nr:urease accessory protein UreD [Pseudomonadales bacterium]MDG1442731.1 urease accessory protein UreD [Pseudomonadales bacterium]
MTIPTIEATKIIDVPITTDSLEDKSGWMASLELEFESRQGLTRMTRSQHCGPLRVQRAFQETDGSCHVYMLHPPGGVVAGDELAINVVAHKDTHAVLTTPAAGKFYRVLANKQPQIQKNILLVKSGGLMEWLPQETIFFRDVNARMETHIQLEGSGQFVGWEINCLGRQASGETFDAGTVRQELNVSRDGKLLHREMVRLQAGANNPLQQSRWGLADQNVFGTLVAVLPFELMGYEEYSAVTLQEQLMDMLSRDTAAPYWGVTLKSGVVLVRYLGPSGQRCREGFSAIRKMLMDNARHAEIVEPRIWST